MDRGVWQTTVHRAARSHTQLLNFPHSFKVRKIINMTMLLLLLSHFSHVQLFVTVALQATLPMGFSRQDYWSGLPCPPPGDLPDPGIESRSPALQEDSLPSEPPGVINAISELLEIGKLVMSF